MYTSHKARIKFDEKAESGEMKDRTPSLAKIQDEEELVSKCSRTYVTIALIATTAQTTLYMMYAITAQSKWWVLAGITLPMSITMYVMSLFMMPRETDEFYSSERFRYIHFVSYVVLIHFFFLIGNAREGRIFYGCLSLLRFPLEYAMFRQALNLRHSVQNFTKKRLSDFLCQQVIIKGMKAIGPMIFFSFETIACLISSNSFGAEECQNTSHAAKYLSWYLGIGYIISICKNTVNERVRQETSWQYTNLASMNLKVSSGEDEVQHQMITTALTSFFPCDSLRSSQNLQKVQGILVLITFLTSLFMLSELGVEGKADSMFLEIVGIAELGVIGVITITSAAVIQLVELVRANRIFGDRPQESELESKQVTPSNLVKEISASDVGGVVVSLILYGKLLLSLTQ